jgi:predicted Zn-dependent protease
MPEEAIGEIREAVRLAPGVAMYRMKLGEVLTGQGKLDQAMTEFREVLRIEPDHPYARYNAACVAALAGCGQGKDDPPFDAAARARWRKQALDWLKADLAAWSKILENEPPQARQVISQTLQHWKADADLAGLRDRAAMDKLPDDEQKACRALWAEVDALLAKAGGGIKPPGETVRLQSAEPSGRLERDHPPPAVDVHHQPAPDQGSQPQERQSA